MQEKNTSSSSAYALTYEGGAYAIRGGDTG